jgi:hypothetical protein
MSVKSNKLVNPNGRIVINNGHKSEKIRAEFHLQTKKPPIVIPKREEMKLDMKELHNAYIGKLEMSFLMLTPCY